MTGSFWTSLRESFGEELPSKTHCTWYCISIHVINVFMLIHALLFDSRERQSSIERKIALLSVKGDKEAAEPQINCDCFNHKRKRGSSLKHMMSHPDVNYGHYCS